MFDKEIEIILHQHKTSLELLEKLHEIYNPYTYSGGKRNEIFYLDIRIEDPRNVETRTRQALNDIFTHNEISPRRNTIKGEVRTIEELAESVRNLSIKDFYFSAVEYFPCNNNKGYTLDNMLYTETRVHWRKLQLILNCIWLLDHDQPIDREIKNKIYKLSENGETFIFSGCKVTNYKNGNLKIQFSNKELFTRFQNNFNEALKVAEEKHKERNKD